LLRIFRTNTRSIAVRSAGIGILVGVVGCSAILGLRDDYQLAGDASQNPDTGAVDAPGEVGSDVGSDAQSDAQVDAVSLDAALDAANIAPPRLISPLSTATTSIQAPTLTWELPAGVTGVRVEICRERACTTVEREFDATGPSAKVPTDLPPGLHFWRVRGKVGLTLGSATSATWEFWARKNSGVAGEFDTSWGGFPDFNGDGVAEVIAAGGPPGVDIFPGVRNTGPTDSASVRVVDPNPRGSENFSRATFGDVDGDGFSDLVFGSFAQLADGGDDGTNRIRIVRGGPAGLSAASMPTWTISVPASDAGAPLYFAATVSVAGDVNGDGYADILASSLSAGSVTGPTYVFFGHASGPSSVPDAELRGEGTAYHMYPGGPIGDVNGDGYADVLCGTEAGYGVFVFLGGPSGPVDTRRHTLTIPASAAGGDFGRLIHGSGDLDGDGYPDFAVSAEFAPKSLDGGQGPGQVYVFRGQPHPGLTTSAWTLTGPGDLGSFGAAGAIAGDFNGDGFDDLVIGAYALSMYNGQAYYYPGGTSGVSDGVRTTIPAMSSGTDYFGSAAPGGDIDGDGVLDILLAGALAGYIQVYYGKVGADILDAGVQSLIHAPSFIYILANGRGLRGKTRT
jgi:hypothetical protein